MRRKDREQSAEFALGVLRDCEYAALATANHDGTPYCVPISPVLIDGAIYFHCALEGKKLDNILSNPSVCITAVRHTKLLPEKFTTEFESAVAKGICKTVDSDEEKISALRGICEKYAADNIKNADRMISASLTRTCVCKITITEITGKAKTPT